MIDMELFAILERDIHPAIGNMHLLYPLSLVQEDFAKYAISQPVCRRRVIVITNVPLFALFREEIEHVGQVLQCPVLPAGSDTGVGSFDLLPQGTLVGAVGGQPVNRTARDQMYFSAGLYQQRAVLNRALAPTDDQQGFAFKGAKILVVEGMRQQFRWETLVFLRPVSIVVQANRHNDGLTTHLTPIFQRQ